MANSDDTGARKEMSPSESPSKDADSAPDPSNDALKPEETGVALAPLPAAATTDEGSGRGLFLAVLLGGFIAGGIGYFAAYYTEFGLFDQGSDDALAALSAQIDSQNAEIAALRDEIPQPAPDNSEELTSLAATVGALGTRLDAVEQAALTADDGAPAEPVDLTAVTDRLDALEAQSAELSTQVDAAAQGPSQDDLAALDARMANVLEQIEGQEAAIADAANAAADETRRVSANGALAEITAAVEAGDPFQDAIGAFSASSDLEVPQVLSSMANTGVASLSTLQADFAAAARAALDASLSEVAGDGVGNRLGAFIRSQTGARSLSEREGSDPDAVLSRAEARVKDGAMGDALAELEQLPEGGRAAMSNWIDAAGARLSALTALDTLATSLNSN